jgi:hypothetical protein
MTPKPLFCSFFTPDYRQEAEELIATLDAHKLEHDVRPWPDAGDWARNCNQKATFLRNMMLEHEGRPLVWLDADARVVAPPVMFDSLTCDFAAHWLDWSDGRKELISSTLYFGPTPGAWDLLKSWMAASRDWPDVWDQKLLQELAERPRTLDVVRLPPAYTYIFDISRDRYPNETPVIKQLQASRRLRR